MNLELTNTMPFGKHKGEKIEDIFKQDGGAGYLVWMREERKKQQGEEYFFSLEVNQLLDMAIQDSSSLKRKYRPWNLHMAQAPVTAPVLEEASGTYGSWGDF